MKQNFQLNIRCGSKKTPGQQHSTHFVYSYDISACQHPYPRVMSIEVSPTTDDDAPVPEYITQLVEAFNKGLITIETPTIDYEKTNPELKRLREVVRKKRREAPTVVTAAPSTKRRS